MAVLGMRGTGSWASGQQPTNFREAILFLYPNSPAILTAITGKLKSESTNDPRFTTFEKGLPVQRAKLTGTHTDSVTQINLDLTTGLGATPAKNFRVGQVVMNERTQEVMWVTGIDTAYEHIDVTRGGSVGSTAAAMVATDYILIIGTHNEEGASTPEAISNNAETSYNFTQIFRTPMKLTGTAKETYLRTGDVEKEMKREIAERHAIEMEWAWLFGRRAEVVGSGGQYDRTTGGVLQFITSNVQDFSGTLSKSAWESFLEGVFTVPGSRAEKLCLCGNKALTAINAMAMSYGHINLTPTSETFGMKLMSYETPYGTLQLKSHPLLSQNATYNDWGIVLDVPNVVYRPLKNRDTKFLKDRQNPGTDAIIHEYLTEAGLELQHESTHGVFKNATVFQP